MLANSINRSWKPDWITPGPAHSESSQFLSAEEVLVYWSIVFHKMPVTFGYDFVRLLESPSQDHFDSPCILGVSCSTKPGFSWSFSVRENEPSASPTTCRSCSTMRWWSHWPVPGVYLPLKLGVNWWFLRGAFKASNIVGWIGDIWRALTICVDSIV